MENNEKTRANTRVEDFLRSLGEVAEPVLESASDLSGNEWLSSIAVYVNKSKELEVEQKKIALLLLEMDLNGIQDARENNNKIQQMENASWIAKNIPYLFDCFILLVWWTITFYIIARWMGLIDAGKEADLTGILGIYSGITALATMVIQFHRGSSRGSQIKSLLLNK